MPALTFENVSKSFGDTQVIHSFDAEIEDGEFLVLLGPSGCGKSTLLRMIAGLTDVTGGLLKFDGEIANAWEVRRRHIAFVFQSYALYPHMSVRANIAFPLVMDAFKGWYHLPIVNAIARRRLMKSPDIAAKTDRIAGQLELDALLERRPANLSGGQRQRVALARALVRNPSLYLLDEPLSNLDAKLRTQMRAEISNLHGQVKKTFIYVTHDQVEAMTMATRIVVMNKGVVQQVGRPEEIYNTPANTFVARFVGAPPMNLIPLSRVGSTVRANSEVSWVYDGPLPEGDELILGIRPEKLRMHFDESGTMPARVAVIERLGGETLIGFSLRGAPHNDNPLVVEHGINYVKVQGSPALHVGDVCSLSFDAADVVWFDPGTKQRIIQDQLVEGIPARA